MRIKMTVVYAIIHTQMAYVYVYWRVFESGRRERYRMRCAPLSLGTKKLSRGHQYLLFSRCHKPLRLVFFLFFVLLFYLLLFCILPHINAKGLLAISTRAGRGSRVLCSRRGAFMHFVWEPEQVPMDRCAWFHVAHIRIKMVYIVYLLHYTTPIEVHLTVYIRLNKKVSSEGKEEDAGEEDICD